MSLLEIDDVYVAYGAVSALRGVSLEVKEGEMVALLGANGAGKTSTLRTISGLMAPTRGSITLAGERIDGIPAYHLVKRGIAHLPEGRDLFPSLSVEENLQYGHWVHRGDRKDYRDQLERAMEYFPRLRERRKQAAGTLSGGEQQMLGVARALMSSPRLLLVDELSLGLAPQIVSLLFKILDDVNRDGTAVLLVEQFVHMALAHTDRAYVLSKGEVVLGGVSQQLTDDPELIASYLGGEGRGADAEPRNGNPNRKSRQGTTKGRTRRTAAAVPGRTKG